MHDDELDPRIADRLRAYESRIPGSAPPDPGARRGTPRALAAGVLGAASLAAVVVALVLVRPGQLGLQPTPSAAAASSTVGSATAQPTGPATVGASPTSAPSEAAATAAPSSTPEPFDDWTLAESFATDGQAEEVDGIAFAAGQFIAIGHQEPLGARGGVGPPQDTPLMWSSVDGRTWSRVALDQKFSTSYLLSIVALPNGDALIYSQGGQTGWRSADGEIWEEVAIGLPGAPDSAVVAGDAGYVTSVTRSVAGERVAEVWHSADGIQWEVSDLQLPAKTDPDLSAPQDFTSMRDLAAGDEGFVAAALLGDGIDDVLTETAKVFASANGREWTEADASGFSEQPALLVAAAGGDWIVAATNLDSGETTIWGSANGLAWDQRTSVEVPAPPSLDANALSSGARPIVGDIVGAGRGVILSGVVQVCCHSPWWAAGVWSSVDARGWDRLDFPVDAVVTHAAHHEGVTVLGGHTGASPDSGWKAVATFWVNGGD